MILVCGPTGSGKTTTLYAALRDIDATQRNIVTIEDPIEVQLDGVTQIPVNEAQGNTFAAMLRSVLRQDPDAILVGEIRDADTARVAMQAAMTGHLVFSTVHTRDAVGTVYRLLDLGVEPFMVAAGLHTVLAQRLVRQLCPYCRTQTKPTQQQIDRLAKVGITQAKHFYGPVGCRRCLNLGYAGRRSIVELLVATDEIKDCILHAPSAQEIAKHLTRESFVSLQESGYTLVAEGVTSFEEVDRAVS
jgi:type II secretory ATPase GspE/PulE/Tfp pilus assembly ATPase PilB-like protein